MIDIHLHILPGVDDGPATLQESLVLAQALVQEGVQVVVATPHSNDEYPRLPATEIRTRVNQLQHVLMQQGLPLHVFAGNEVLIRAGLVDEIRAGRVATLNGGRYLLLELWNTMWLPETEQVIFGLLSQGIVPIIAHPERYTTIQKDPSRLIALIRQGALAQLTASSVLGLHGSTVKRTAETLLKQGLIHFLASDAHGMHRRPPYMAKSLKQIETLVGAERVRLMTETWPTAIVKNEWVNAHIETHMQVGNSEKRHFLQFWH
ncbi:MAG TPA: tyrosine protein phosphatase [Ktedonobacter sp.]|nr:tyrosine protein phosphatase [Ktedonobacter sp.]